MVSIIGIIHLKPGFRILIYFPNLNFKALLYSNITRIPLNKNIATRIVKNNGGYILMNLNLNTNELNN